MDAIVRQWQAWDALCSEHVRTALARCGFTELLHAPSPALASRPFVSSPTPLVTAIIVYLAIVAYGRLFRKRKEPDSPESAALKLAVKAHNAFLVLLSTYMCLTVVKEAVRNKYTLFGNSYKRSEQDMANVLYVFYISKIYEFFDTVRPPSYPSSAAPSRLRLSARREPVV